MTNNPLEKFWDKFKRTSKIAPSMESLNVDFFNFLPKLSNVLFWVAS